MRKSAATFFVLMCLLFLQKEANSAVVSWVISNALSDGTPFDMSDTNPQGVHHYRFQIVYDGSKGKADAVANPDLVIDNVPKYRTSWCAKLPIDKKFIVAVYAVSCVVFNDNSFLCSEPAFWLNGNVVGRDQADIDTAIVGPLDWLFVTDPLNFGRFIGPEVAVDCPCDLDTGADIPGKPDFNSVITDLQAAASMNASATGWIDGGSLVGVNSFLGNACK